MSVKILQQLKAAGLIEVARGTGGVTITRPLARITFLDVYKAVECAPDEELFRFHENPNQNCPVGRNIHRVLESEAAGGPGGNGEKAFRNDAC